MVEGGGGLLDRKDFPFTPTSFDPEPFTPTKEGHLVRLLYLMLVDLLVQLLEMLENKES